MNTSKLIKSIEVWVVETRVSLLITRARTL